MKNNNLKLGLIAGAISSIWLIVLPFAGHNIGDTMGMIYGYTAMIVGFAMIFVGIKNYRDDYNNGEVSFGKAFRIGLTITLIASTVYVIAWLLIYNFMMPDFMEKMSERYIEGMKSSGASQAIIEAKTQEMIHFSEMYKNPFFNALITYTEILPVGLIISVIASLILKRRNQVIAG